MPHSTFLRFPGDEINRIIALPAYLGDGFDVAGVKWIASFPGNLPRGLPRASAILILNSCVTGRPEAILDGALISARRTAASAALAARAVAGPGRPDRVGIVGTGPINLEVVRFLRETLPGLGRLLVFDLDPSRAAGFGARAAAIGGDLRVETAPDLETVLRRCPLVSFATSAVTPHVSDLSVCPPGATILHVSLRDLSPEAILAADNVVDDPDHVCRAETSVDLAERAVGHRRFLRCTLAEILEGSAPVKEHPEAVTVFSPFGLGILDLAVAKRVLELALDQAVGTRLPGFLATA